MPLKKPSPSERLSAHFAKLRTSAAALNVASDELGKSITELDAALKRLNLGVSAWVLIDGHLDDSTGEFWNRKIGYAKVGSRWGIAVSTAEGFVQDPDSREDGEKWLFNDAPRALRVIAVEKLPDLIETLVSEAEKTTANILDKTVQAREFADAINALVSPHK